MSVWLVLATVLVDIEYYDGLSAICNARYFLGESGFYFFDRGPLMAWLLMPAEAIKGWLALHPLNVRPHHATLALLHIGYLVVIYRVLTARFGHGWPVLSAFASAVISYIFISYAPFISHDIAPGLLLLWMLIASERLAHEPRFRWWLSLVVAGTAAPLIKQTFGLFWVAVLAAHALPALLAASPEYRTSRRTLTWLAAGAAASAVLAWAVYGIVLGNWIPQVPVWLRPYRNLQYLAGVYDGTDVVFPLWIYIKNLWAYGRLTTVLLIPGLVLSLRGSRFQRRLALGWITAVILVHAMPLREVRYLAFLAPLTVFLIVPAVKMVSAHKPGVALLVALLAFDIGGVAVEATRIAQPFYRVSEARRLLEILPPSGPARPPIFHNVSMLSFAAPGQSPLAADRYHRIFHLGVNQISVLYGYEPQQTRLLPPLQVPAMIGTAPDGSVLLFSNQILAYGPTWRPAPPIGSESLVQGIAVLRSVMAQQTPVGYRTSDGREIAVNAASDGALTTVRISGLGLDAQGIGDLMPTAMLSAAEVYALQPAADGSLVFKRAGPTASLPNRLIVRAFVIQRLTPRIGESAGR